ncbi:MAG: DedA family protein [Tannerellaceae bacterium]|nr:DedA family protein [Tannerellaceae bacterium]
MEYLQTLIDIVLNLDVYLGEMITIYKNWIYLILFLVIFSETGLFFMAFLPGDSLLFVTGALAAAPANHLNVHLIVLLFIAAAILGNITNYAIGSKLGVRLTRTPNPRYLKPRHLEATHRFYEKYGGKTIVLARFVPFVRTFAPFIAGMGKMDYNRFIYFTITGAIFWNVSLIYAGYFLGNVPFVRDNIPWFILLLIVLSNLPATLEIIKKLKERKK